jgi:hypothetical protein
VSSIAGFIVIHASRNYHAEAAICELISRFPDLAFHGSLYSDMGYGHYTLFEGCGGEAKFRDLVIPNFEERFLHAPRPA